MWEMGDDRFWRMGITGQASPSSPALADQGQRRYLRGTSTGLGVSGRRHTWLARCRRFDGQAVGSTVSVLLR